MPFLKKISPRRSRVRKNLFAERFSQISQLANTENLISILLWLLFVVLCIFILSFQRTSNLDIIPIAIIVILISLAGALYIYHYQKRLIKNHIRVLVLIGLFTLLLASTKFITRLISLQTQYTPLTWATGTAVITAIILSIAYDQRFAIGMSIFYCLLVC